MGSDEFAEIFPTSAIFSDVDINFKSDQITSVTSRNIDESVESIRSSSDLPTEINQLIMIFRLLMMLMSLGLLGTIWKLGSRDFKSLKGCLGSPKLLI